MIISTRIASLFTVSEIQSLQYKCKAMEISSLLKHRLEPWNSQRTLLKVNHSISYWQNEYTNPNKIICGVICYKHNLLLCEKDSIFKYEIQFSRKQRPEKSGFLNYCFENK